MCKLMDIGAARYPILQYWENTDRPEWAKGERYRNDDSFHPIKSYDTIR